MRDGRIGNRLEDVLENRFRLQQIATGDQAAGEQNPRVEPARVARDRRARERDRGVGRAGLQVQLRELDLRARGAGIELHDLVERFLGLVPPGHRREHFAPREVRRRGRGVRLDRAVGPLERRVVVFAVEQHARLDEQRVDLLRLLFQNRVDGAGRVVRASGGVVEGRQPDLRGRADFLVADQLLQDFRGLGQPRRPEVVLRERKTGAARAVRFHRRLEVLLSLVRPVRRLVERRRKTVDDDVARREVERALHVRLCLRGARSQPVELRQRQLRGNRVRRLVHGLLVCRLGVLELAGAELERRQVRVRACARRVETDRLLELLDRAVEVLQTGERVAERDGCAKFVRIAVQHLLRPVLGVREPTAQEEQVRGLQLRLDVLGHQVGSANGFRERARAVAEADVRAGELEARLAEVIVFLDGVPVLDDGVRVLVLRHIRVGAREVLPFQRFRIVAAPGRGEYGGQRQSRAPECGNGSINCHDVPRDSFVWID